MFNPQRSTQNAPPPAFPDVGNLHHFCHRFLKTIGRMYPGKHVLDEVQQIGFIREVVDVLRAELKDGASADLKRTHGVTVIGLLGEVNELRRRYLDNLIEEVMATAVKNDRNRYADILSGVLIAHQRRTGIDADFIRPMPPMLFDLSREKVLRAIDIAYCGLKRKFKAVDFDDLVNETFLWLENNDLDEDRKFIWVQIDEVQDLSPMQWRIVERITARDAVSVYFGDVEQAIFSFLGASIPAFNEATADCARHYFKTNFRATPKLLEILMRYSIASLKSDWEFLPAPVDAHRGNGELSLHETKGTDAVVGEVRRLLDGGIAENAAILVRRNVNADAFEPLVKALGYRYAKVSGRDLFSFGPMRDFLSFVSLFCENVPRVSWECLVRRFGAGARSRVSARYFVRGMFASGFKPKTIFDERSPVGLFASLRASRGGSWSRRNRSELKSLRTIILPAYRRVLANLDRRMTFREVFEIFSRRAYGDESRYSAAELPVARSRERIEKFLRYTDHIYREDTRSFRQILDEDWDRLSKLKEADLLVGDEQVVLSTIHKAKGRQFDAVVIPDAADVLNPKGAIDPGDPLRLLYVAMSRAKRHLAMFGTKGVSVLNPVRPCFVRGYRGYYLDKAEGRSREGDWLEEWERVASYCRAGQCPPDGAEKDFGPDGRYLTRIRLKSFGYCPDARVRRGRSLAAISSKIADADVAIDCLRQAGDYSFEVWSAIRNAVLSVRSAKICAAGLRYFKVMLNSGDCGCHERALQAIGDYLYLPKGSDRLEAAGLLSGCMDRRLAKLITGGADDFERLALVRDPEHENSIHVILASSPPPVYDSRLRAILHSRAARGTPPL